MQKSVEESCEGFVLEAKQKEDKTKITFWQCKIK
jgi:hypothetical protein